MAYGASVSGLRAGGADVRINCHICKRRLRIKDFVQRSVDGKWQWPRCRACDFAERKAASVAAKLSEREARAAIKLAEGGTK